MRKHYEKDHKMDQEKSKVVCKHWRNGNCFKGNKCDFSHVGHQNTSNVKSTSKTSTKVPACKNGSSCDWLGKGICSFFHPQVGVQKPRTKNDRQDGSWQESRRPVRHQELRRLGGNQEARGPGGRQESRSLGGWQQRQSRNQTQQSRQQGNQSDREMCRFDGRCERIPNCPYIHSMEDFPPLLRRGQVSRRNSNQRRN